MLTNQICQTAVHRQNLSSGRQPTAASCYVLLLVFRQKLEALLMLPSVSCANSLELPVMMGLFYVCVTSH